MIRLWFLFAAGCGSEPASPKVDTAKASFPSDFLWGTATSGFQVDMGCPTWTVAECDDPASDWYQWVTDQGIITSSNLFVSGEPVSAGPGMWELFESDVEQMAADGMTAYRFSLEWSRLFPDGGAEGATSVEELSAHVNQDAVDRYHEMFTALAAANIEPLVTLNHYTMPLWVHNGVECHDDPDSCEADGWVSRERITRLIGLYAGYAGREFGGEVDQWVTLNEPFATTLSGYAFPGADRSAPPGLSIDIPRTVAVMQNQILGHGSMFHALKANDLVDSTGDGAHANVGIVMNMVAITPRDPEREEDVRSMDNVDYLYHRLYLDALTSGAWDEDLDGVADETKSELMNTLDFIGVNYYNEVIIAGFPFPPYDGIPVFDFYPEFSWEPYPEGLAQVLDSASRYGLPIYVTENGTPYVEEQGSEVLAGHLQSVASSLADGVDVRGYFYWSYVDNYEWNHGFELRFGLYELDPVTKERIPRAVRDTYREIIASGQL
jgi:beta-glucosidase/6-phospho-beta-glucosidase/beta-galactosidase